MTVKEANVLKDRIKKIRKDFNLNQTDFGKAIGASQFLVTSYETGRSEPDDFKKQLICERYSVNPVWLETGDGEPYDTRAADIGQEIRDIMRGEDPFAAAVLTSLAQMPAEWWQAFREKLYDEMDKQKKSGRG